MQCYGPSENYGHVTYFVKPNGDKYACVYATHEQNENLECTALFYETGEFQEFTDESGRYGCLLYTSPSPRDATLSRMPSSA